MVFRSWVTDFEARVVAVDTQILIRPIWLEFNRGYKGVRSRWSLFVRDSRGFRRDREHLVSFPEASQSISDNTSIALAVLPVVR